MPTEFFFFRNHPTTIFHRMIVPLFQMWAVSYHRYCDIYCSLIRRLIYCQFRSVECLANYIEYLCACSNKCNRFCLRFLSLSLYFLFCLLLPRRMWIQLQNLICLSVCSQLTPFAARLLSLVDE